MLVEFRLRKTVPGMGGVLKESSGGSEFKHDVFDTL
jgi:hypothetical protein